MIGSGAPDNYTPTQIASHERSKAFKAKIAEIAANRAPTCAETYFRPPLKDGTTEKVLPPIPNEVIRQASEMEMPASNQYGPRIDFIYKTVAKHFGVSYVEMRSSRRTRNIVWPRQIAFYLARTLTLRSLPEIGRRMGGRDHSTVLHGIRKVEVALASDPSLSAKIDKLKEKLCEDAQ